MSADTASGPQISILNKDMKGISLEELGIDESDLAFEKDIQQYPFSVKHWERYLDHKSEAPAKTLCILFERSVRSLPGSYKLWKRYLDYRVSQLAGFNVIRDNEEFERVNLAYERSLVTQHKRPRIWQDYLEFCMRQPTVTETRRRFDRALRALPITQHKRIWELYTKFSRLVGGITALRVFRRYVQVFPERESEYIELCEQLGEWEAAARRLCDQLNRDSYGNRSGAEEFQIWMRLADIITTNPAQLQVLDVDHILKDGVHRYPEQAARLWTSLARFHISLGHWEKARDVYEEALSSVRTIRDFSQVFNAYVEVEEKLLGAALEQEASSASSATEPRKVAADIDLRLMRFERLLEERPFLLNDVLLRQNRNSVHEWIARADLYIAKNQWKRAFSTMERAAKIVNPHKAGPGRYSDLWLKLARMQRDQHDIRAASDIFERATKATYHQVNELVDVWIAYAEMIIEDGSPSEALQILSRATAHAPSAQIDYRDETISPQKRIFKSFRLLSLLVDLEESRGLVEPCRATYERILDLRIATPMTVVNYAAFLWQHQYFEDAFRVFERGIDLFSPQISFELWNIYLAAFVRPLWRNKAGTRARSIRARLVFMPWPTGQASLPLIR